MPVELLDARCLQETDPAAAQNLLDHRTPWAVIHSSDHVERLAGSVDPGANRCEAGNTTHLLAKACAERGIPLLILSSSQGIDQKNQQPIYHEDYSHSMAAAGVGTDVCLGPWDGGETVWTVVRALAVDEADALTDSCPFTSTDVPDLVRTCLDRLLDGENGSWDLSNVGTPNQVMPDHCVLAVV